MSESDSLNDVLCDDTSNPLGSYADLKPSFKRPVKALIKSSFFKK